MPLDLGRRLHAAGAVLSGELRRAVFETLSTDKPFPRALADASTAARSLLERPLNDGDAPVIRTVVPHPELLAALPPGMAARLLVVPLGRERLAGRVDVAVVDAADAHVAAELAFHLGAPVRLIAAPLAEIERALLIVRRQPVVSTADKEPAPSRIPPPPESQAVVAPVSTPQEDAVPLVRRPRGSATEAPPSARIGTRNSDPPDAIPLSRRARVSQNAPITSPIESRADSAPPVQMVVDFRASARAERSESSHRPADLRKPKLDPRRPPFPSLTPILEAIDDADDRTALIEAVLRGLATTSTAAALFAPRRGRFAGVGAIGEVDPEAVRAASLPASGVIGDAIARNERLGTIDPRVDPELFTALGLGRFAPVHVLVYPSFVADRPALLLMAMGIGDVIEATRRARVLSTAASNALERLLRR